MNMTPQEDKKVAVCADCADWAGRCVKGKIDKVASDPKCPDFTEKTMMTLRYSH